MKGNIYICYVIFGSLTINTENYTASAQNNLRITLQEEGSEESIPFCNNPVCKTFDYPLDIFFFSVVGVYILYVLVKCNS